MFHLCLNPHQFVVDFTISTSIDFYAPEKLPRVRLFETKGFFYSRSQGLLLEHRKKLACIVGVKLDS